MPEFRKGKEIDFKLNLDNGKYTFIQYKDGGSEALRYGEPWQDTTGNNLVFALAHKLHEVIGVLAATAEAMRSASDRSAKVGLSLVEQVRQAQVQAGEDMVINNLKARGLFTTDVMDSQGKGEDDGRENS